MSQFMQSSSGGSVRSALCVALLAGAAATAHAQRFQRYIGANVDERPTNVERVAGDGFVIAGQQIRGVAAVDNQAFTTRTDANGIVQWTTVVKDVGAPFSDVGALAARELSNTDIAVGYERNTAGILNLGLSRLLPNGLPAWFRSYTAEPIAGRLAVRGLSAVDNIVVATQGIENAFGAPLTAGVFLRTDAGGNLTAFARYVNITFTPLPGDMWLSDIRPVGTAGAGFYVCGGVEVNTQVAGGFLSRQLMLVMQIDPVGNVIWAFAYAPPVGAGLFSERQGLTGLDVSANGDIVVVGYANDALGAERLNVMRLTGAGVPIWLRQYTDLNTQAGVISKNIREAPNGDLVIGANATPPAGAPTGPMTILRTNAAGFPNVVRSYSPFNGATQPATNALIVGPNLDAMAIAGVKNPPAVSPVGFGRDDIVLARTDAAGETGCLENRFVQQPLSITPQFFQLAINVNRQGDFADWSVSVDRPNFGQTSVCCPGDINGDNQVNFADLNAVLSAFGNPYAFANLNAVLSNFGGSCPP